MIFRATLLILLPALAGLGVARLLAPLGVTALIAAVVVAGGVAFVMARLLLAQIEQVRREVDALSDPAEERAERSRIRIWAEPLAGIARAARREAAAFNRRLEAQSERLARLEAVAHALPEAVVLIDDAGRVLTANAAARRLFGRDAVGADIFGLVRDPAFQDSLPKALADRGTATAEFDIDTPQQRSIRALIRSVPAVVADDIAAIIVLQDITALRRLDQMRVDFVANVSHELRTPLSSLIGFLETLRGPARNDPEAQARFLEIMQEQAERMSRIVEDLLSLSRIEMDALDAPQEVIAVMPVVQQLVEALQMQASQKGLRFVIHPAPDDGAGPPAVIADRDQLAQVLQNLMDNALKYGGRDATVDIAVSRTANAAGADQADDAARHPAIRIDVTDHGEGIAPEHLSRLTERFYRVDKARSRQMGGTGLGLAIVKHIMNRHKGRLEIASTPGSGSTFSIFLPAAETASTPAPGVLGP